MEDELNVEGAAPADDATLAAQIEGQAGEEQPGNDPAARAGEGEGDQPKPKQTAQERISELTRARREADRRAEAAERERDDLRKRVPAPEAPKEPKAADYTYGEDDAAFIRDQAKFEARQEYETATREREARSQVEAVEKAWDDRQVAFAADKPDFFEKVSANDLPITPTMAQAIKTADDGPAIAYHLASNPDEARRLAALDPIAQVREIGRLEATLAPPSSPNTPAAKTVSDAPAPPQKLRGQGGRFQVAADTDDFAAFERAHGNKI